MMGFDDKAISPLLNTQRAKDTNFNILAVSKDDNNVEKSIYEIHNWGDEYVHQLGSNQSHMSCTAEHSATWQIISTNSDVNNFQTNTVRLTFSYNWNWYTNQMVIVSRGDLSWFWMVSFIKIFCFGRKTNVYIVFFILQWNNLIRVTDKM